jgi:hypothetical protein
MERITPYMGGTIKTNVEHPGIYSMGIDSASGKTFR